MCGRYRDAVIRARWLVGVQIGESGRITHLATRDDIIEEAVSFALGLALEQITLHADSHINVLLIKPFSSTRTGHERACSYVNSLFFPQTTTS